MANENKVKEKTSLEQVKEQLEEFMKKQNGAVGVPCLPIMPMLPSFPCPSCGRCPTCGRGGQITPDYTWRPWAAPTYTITCETSTNNLM